MVPEGTAHLFREKILVVGNQLKHHCQLVKVLSLSRLAREPPSKLLELPVTMEARPHFLQYLPSAAVAVLAAVGVRPPNLVVPVAVLKHMTRQEAREHPAKDSQVAILLAPLLLPRVVAEPRSLELPQEAMGTVAMVWPRQLQVHLSFLQAVAVVAAHLTVQSAETAAVEMEALQETRLETLAMLTLAVAVAAAGVAQSAVAARAAQVWLYFPYPNKHQCLFLTG